MAQLITTLGGKAQHETGIVLPHEHIFANFYTGDDCGATVEQVVHAVRPAVEAAQRAGITGLADATSIGGARRLDILQAVSESMDFPVLVATGIFKDPWKTDWVARMGRAGLAEWMVRELSEGVEGTGIRAGWIKLSASDAGLSDAEKVLVSAAADASRETGAAIGSHTVSGQVAMHQLELIESAGCSPDRFIWVHTHVEPDFAHHLEAARRGAWIEYDAIGDVHQGADSDHIERIQLLVDEGLANRLLLSHDCHGYDPRLPGGGPLSRYTYIAETFVPKLRQAGLSDDVIDLIQVTNPFLAYAR